MGVVGEGILFLTPSLKVTNFSLLNVSLVTDFCKCSLSYEGSSPYIADISDGFNPEWV